MRTYLALFIAVLLALTLGTACDSDSPTDRGATSLPIETLAKFSSSGYAEPQRLAIDDADELERVWQITTAGQSPPPPLPPVDFGSKMVVLAAAGGPGNGCHSIEVTAATATPAGVLEVEVTETVPGPNCVCTAVATQPVHLVALPRVQGRKVFLDQTRVLSC